MQLNNNQLSRSTLAEKLAIAATTLIANTAISAEEPSNWDFSASLLAYSEPERVSATEFIFTADKVYEDDSRLSFKVVLDSLTGASANGAIAQDSVQTFTRVSANGQYEAQALETPLDDNYRDSRGQINIGWTAPLTEDSRYTLNSNISKEIDYLSLGLSAEYAHDFDRKNTTLSAGLSFGLDSLTPLGDVPISFSSMVVDQGQFATQEDFLIAQNATRSSDSETVNTSEMIFGWTQVVNRRMLMQFNYGFSNTSGYLTDPYKILSVVNSAGETQDLIYENRPDKKVQHSLYAMTKYHLDESIFDISYRFLTNDWGIQSHTIDTHWRIFSDNNSFWEPHLRFYQQGEADFYTPFLAQGQALPQYASADYRVGNMDAITVGLKYGFEFGNSDRAEIRLEYYLQTPNEANQPDNVSFAEGIDLYPKVDAIILQFNYYF